MRFPKLSKDTFRLAQDSAILVNASALSGLLFLLVHPILGRMLPDTVYATFVQLMGLLTVLGVPATAVQVAITRYVAEFAHGNQQGLWVTVVRRALRRMTWIAGLALVAWTACAGLAADALHVDTPLSLVVVGVATAVSLYIPIVHGTLQGAMLFRWLAAAALGAGLLRVIFCASAAAISPTVTSALLAVTASIAGGVLLGAWPFRRILAGTPALPGFDTKPIYRYLWPVCGGQAAVFLFVNADLILSARLLSETSLGMYGKVAMLSRTVLFIAQPIAAAMFPRAVNSDRLRVLLIPLGAAFAITLAGAVGLTVMPGLPMRLMYGVDDPAYDALTRQYVWAAFPHAMAMFIAQYLWARHQPLRVLWLLPAVIAYTALLAGTARTPEAVIGLLAIAGWIAFAVLTVCVLVRRRVAPVPEARA